MLRILLFLIVLFPCVVLGQPPADSNEPEIPSDDQPAQETTSDGEVESSVEQLTPSAAREIDPLPTDLSPIVSADESDQKTNRYSENKIAEKDLFAQQAMAWGAWFIVVITALALGVSYWAVRLLKATLKANKYLLNASRRAVTVGRRSAIAAERATVASNEMATAAIDSNRIMQMSAEIQSRAYISVIGVELIKTNYGMPWIFKIEFKNYGQTPAYKIRIYWRDFLRSDSFDETTIPTVDMGIWDNKGYAPLASERGWHDEIEGRIEIPLPRDTNNYLLYLVGKIIYVDIFGNGWETEFAREIITPSQSWKIPEFGNDAT